MRISGQGPDEPEELQDAMSVLSTTLNMIVKDFDSMDLGEIRELAWVAKYEADKLMDALRSKSAGRRALLAQPR